MYNFFYKKVWCLFLFCLVLFSCQSTEQNLSITAVEADVTSNAELKLSEYFENFMMLKLPTDIVIGQIQRIIYENNLIYISDGQTLFIFSDDGEMLSCFQKIGNGPGEYKNINDFMVDGEAITILDRSQQRLLIYDHSGESISTHNLGYYAQAISPTVNNSFFLYFDNAFSHKLRRVKNGQEDSMYLAVDNDRDKYLFIFSYHNFYKYQESIYFFQEMNDTIYKSVGGGSIKPSFYVDFKGRNIPASFFKERYRNVIAFFDKLYTTSYAYGVLSFAIYDRFMMFGSSYRQDTKLTVFDLKNDISNTFASIKDDVYFKGLTIPVSEFIYHANNRIFVPLDAFSITEWRNAHPPSEQFKEMVNATKEEDNPLLLIFDFKK